MIYLFILLSCVHKATLSGYVLNDSGLGIQGASIRLTSGFGSSITDSAGSWKFEIPDSTMKIDFTNGVKPLGHGVSIFSRAGSAITMRTSDILGRHHRSSFILSPGKQMIIPFRSQSNLGIEYSELSRGNDLMRKSSIIQPPLPASQNSPYSPYIDTIISNQPNGIIDTIPILTYNDSGAIISAGTSWSSSKLFHGYTDLRDSNRYRTVKIGQSTWFAENLHHMANGSSWCYAGKLDQCDTYGSLSSWSGSMALPSSCDSNSCIQSNPRSDICPPGWHIPSRAEWIAAMRTADSLGDSSSRFSQFQSFNSWIYMKKGKDALGLRILAAGERSMDGSYNDQKVSAGYWIPEEITDKYAWAIFFSAQNPTPFFDKELKSTGLSTRCIQN